MPDADRSPGDPTSPEDTSPESTAGGPLLGLVARGLELWLRQRCQAVQTIEIHLDGSMGGLLRGHLRGVRLQARRVVFENLSLEWVELRSEAIQVRTGGLLRGQSLRLDHPFRVRGSVHFTEEGLSHSLTTTAWRELGDLLSEQFLGVSPLETVRLRDESLIVQARDPHGLAEVETRLVLTSEGLGVLPLDGRPMLPLPMDPAITLERAEVRAGRMELAGEALVRP
ncbi:MAG: DUF2993 domain-containing protein [Cyanobacteria bacterium K_Offshore_surface_m2_239]|nr:DUF2993 domain-containing protein [Cyanobacteria bacterium K_Offshore_surface_m2_239]